MGQQTSAYLFGGPLPNDLEPPKYDQTLGFEEGRAPRVSRLTEEQMSAAKIPARFRDYCAAEFAEYKKCKYYEFPFLGRCKPYLHVWEECQYQDHVLRMKEYERERRLMLREARKAELDALNAQEAAAH